MLDFPSSLCGSKIDYLISLGIAEESARWITEYIEQYGCLMKQWGCDQKSMSLLNSLHDGAWFHYGDLSTCIKTLIGGRQGCKFGAMIFNGGYSLALFMLHKALLKDDVVLRVSRPGGAFWLPPSSNTGAQDVPVIDATFVDDDAIVLVAPTPRLLDHAISRLLEITVQVFSLLSLRINWKPGKSEAMLKYRGRRACKHYEARRIDGKLFIPVPGSGGERLTVVQRYKHLGGFHDITGAVLCDAKHKVDVALSAFVQLAHKVFGCPTVGLWMKHHFAQSLVHARLFYNAHTVTPTRTYIKVLNRAYMRVLRRCVGMMLFDENSVSDRQVRELASQPSVDCILWRRRLLYLGCLMRKRPVTLTALLHARVGDRRLPWVNLIIGDMCSLRDSGFPMWSMPHPDSDAEKWAELIDDEREWARGVEQLHFTQSICDERHAVQTAAGEGPFTCCACTNEEEIKGFATEKALNAHRRTKHGVRTEVRMYVRDGKCPVCATDFKSRLRCIAHLSDTRRPKCRDRVLSGECTVLTPVEVLGLQHTELATLIRSLLDRQ